MSEGDDRPWGSGEPPHGYVCRFCGKVITQPKGCEVGTHGLHHRSMEATARWHRTIEEVAAVSMASARGEKRRRQFIVKINLGSDRFDGGYKDRDFQIAQVLYDVADRMMRGNYSPDEPNKISKEWSTIGSFKFKEG